LKIDVSWSGSYNAVVVASAKMDDCSLLVGKKGVVLQEQRRLRIDVPDGVVVASSLSSGVRIATFDNKIEPH
jgi:hypothetical protein